MIEKARNTHTYPPLTNDKKKHKIKNNNRKAKDK